MDASVEYLLQNLKQLVEHHTGLIGGAEHELKRLNEELDVFKAILKDGSRKYAKDKVYQEWEKKIREAVYDIEDVIDTCVTEANAGKSRKSNWFKKKFSSRKASLLEEIKNIRQNVVQPLKNEFQTVEFSIADSVDTVVEETTRARQQKSRHMVGFEEEAETFINRLVGESDELEICSVIGMAGLGKTVFAWKVFENSTIKFEFPVRIWVNVSENFHMKMVLLNILSNFIRKPDESLTIDELTCQVREHLERGKFLIVMDDIWTISVWKQLLALLPRENAMGRVLITTRNTDVGRNASTQLAYNMRFLNSSESWDLLRYQVYGKLEDVPKELVNVGKRIADDCKGLPLSIVVMGGILEEKTARSGGNLTALMAEWKEVSMSMRSYLVDGDKKGLLGGIVSLSYDKLPYELRNCFLYLGVFPEDANIPIKQLIRLWVAEGFIQDTRRQSSEEVGYDYLKELIGRNLVMVTKTKPDGEAKICQIHDSVREICKQEGRKLNLFQELELSKSGRHSDLDGCRRLCIHSHALEFFSKRPKLPKIRSFLCFNESPTIMDQRDISSITDAFGLLRVYDAKNLKFPRLPPKFAQQLTHLRYLTLAVADGAFEILPEIVTELWNLQSLIVDTPSPTLEVKGDLSKMRQLRHFETRASIIFRKIGEGEGSGKLQTLGRLSPDSCTDVFCRKARSLLTLGIQGDLGVLGESKCLEELRSLNKLKLVHKVSHGSAAESPLRRLPDSRSFPPRLRILVLSGTRLDWEKMSLLSDILSLEVLKLKENAFQGPAWEATGRGFSELAWLHIEMVDLKRWTASSDYFPSLRILSLKNCEKLLEIPSNIGERLEFLSLERIHEDAVSCAKKIVEEQKKRNREVKLEYARWF